MKNSQIYLLGGSALALALSIAISTPALAQEASSALAAEDGIEDIVVVAQRREQNLQDVPIAVTALSGDALQERGVNSGSDLQFVAPGLSFGRSTTTQGVSTLRGVGAVNISVGGDPGVALYVDGNYIQNSAYVTQDFFDVERVEVLRGPQGTLYGRNAIGGAINIITARPEDEFQLSAGLQLTNYDGIKVSGMINAPLGDIGAIRIAGVRDWREGFVTNITSGPLNGDDLDRSNYYALRGSLLLEPANGVELLVRGYVYRNRPNTPVLITNPYPSGPFLPAVVLDAVNPIGPSGPNFVPVPNPYLAPGVGTNPTLANLRVTRNDTPTSTQDKAHGFSASLSVDLSDSITLRSLTSYNRSSNDARQDTDGSDVVFSDQTVALDYETFSQELNLNYSNGRWAGVAGLFLYDENSEVFFSIDTFPFAANQGPGTFVPTRFSRINLNGALQARSYAGFAQLDGPITEQLEFTIGGRFSRDEKRSSENLNFPNFLLSVTNFRQDDAWKSFDWRAGLRYHVNDDVMLYASYASGYKSGGFNIGGTQPSYRPETVDSFELGLRSTFFDKRLRFNLTGFYTDYQDKQENKIETVQAQLVNAASAQVYGLEIEMQLRPSNALTFDANLTYLNARYRDFLTSDPLNIPAGNVQLRGNQLTYSPTWKLGVGGQYEFDLGNAGGLTLRGDLSCADDQFVSAFNRPGDRLESYCRGNLRAGWRSDNERYSVDVFANNIGNVDVVESRLLTATILGPNYNSLVQSPRVYGVRFGVEF